MSQITQAGNSIRHTAAAAIANGQLVLVGNTIGMAAAAAVTGGAVTLFLEGVVTAAKDAGPNSDFAIGERVYYMTTGGVQKFTGVAAAGQLAGTAWAAAVTGDTTASVKLLGQAAPLETQA